MSVTVRIVGAASGIITAYDGMYVESWNPHTRAGILNIIPVKDRSNARRFESHAQVMEEWRTISRVEHKRPWDGKPNRPLTAVTIDIQQVD